MNVEDRQLLVFICLWLAIGVNLWWAWDDVRILRPLDFRVVILCLILTTAIAAMMPLVT